jgi:potassium/hydrogen antiporter
VGKPVVELGLPKTALTGMTNRGSKYISPNGSVSIQAGGQLLFLTNGGEEIGKLNQPLDV